MGLPGRRQSVISLPCAWPPLEDFSMRLRLSLLAALLVCAGVAVAAQPWKRYGNDRFGVTADVPADWHAQPPPENGDGLTFLSPDGKASLAVYGRYVMEDSAASALEAGA